MSDSWLRVSARIDNYLEDIIRFQSELTAIPALGPVNGGQGEKEKAELTRRWLELLEPDEILEINAPDDRVECGYRPNLAAIFKGSGQEKSKVWVLSHLDIVPPGESSLWDSDPYTLRREGDMIYGRGVEDNQHGIVASFFAVKALRDEGVKPKHDIGLIFVADEETGSDFGLTHILNARPELFSPDDLIIVPDSGSEDGAMIEISEKSLLWLKITVKGKQCHASTPGEGINTMRASARLICALDEALPKSFDGRDGLFSVPASTFEPTKKEPNVPNINTIPGEDVFYIDCRVIPRYSLEDVVAKVRETADRIEAETGVRITLEKMQAVQSPAPTPFDAPVVKALTRAVKEVHGLEAKPMGIGGGTVAAMFRKKGLPAAVWSTSLENAHQPNEKDSLANIVADTKVFAHVYLGL